MIRYPLICFSLFLLFSASPSFANQTEYTGGENALIEAFFWYSGKNMKLEAYAEKCPEQAPRLSKQQTLFKQRYQQAASALDLILQSYFSDWQTVKLHFQGAVAQGLSKQDISCKGVSTFANNMDTFLSGGFYSPHQRTLFMFHPGYQQNPEREMADGFSFKYTFTFPLSNVSLLCPVSWGADFSNGDVLQSLSAYRPEGGVVRLTVETLTIQDMQEIPSYLGENLNSVDKLHKKIFQAGKIQYVRFSGPTARQNEGGQSRGEVVYFCKYKGLVYAFQFIFQAPEGLAADDLSNFMALYLPLTEHIIETTQFYKKAS